MPDRVLTVFALLAVSGACAAELPPHPRLLLDRTGIAQLKGRIGSQEWAKSAWESLKKRADDLVEKKVELPPRGGNWYHWYACPTHGVRLSRGKQVGPWQWEHICSVDNEVLKGDPTEPSRDYDGCVIGDEHYSWATATRDLGLAYQITGERKYADKAREILLAYARAYPTYPLHTVHGESKIGGGRMGAQSLDESVRLIPFCQGADLVWETLTERERGRIAGRFIIPAVKEVILPHHLGIHNIQCWKNSAVGLAGFLLGDTDLIDAAIGDPDRGYHVQMIKGVTADGGWWEGAWGYHFYTMNALWPLTEAARNCGMQLYGAEFRRMFDAPLKFAMPNLRLPAFSDSGVVDLSKSRGIYELAYSRYRDPAYLSLISSSARISDYAFWYGEASLPAAPVVEHRSANYPESGYAILTQGKGEDATWLCFKYGPYGGGHGHPDKLSFVMYSRGRVIAVDPGTALYGLPIQNGWFKTSLAHNTLIVDEASQKAVDGKLVSFGSDGGVDFAAADAGEVYDGVRYVRKIALLDQNLVAIVDQVTSEEPRTLDIAYHQHGQWVDLVPGKPWNAPDKPGYMHLKDCTSRKITGPAHLATRLADQWHVAITVDAGDDADLITATGVTSETQDRVPCAVVRKQGKELAVIWVISLDGKPARVERSKTAAPGSDGLPPAAYRVTSDHGRTWDVTGI